MDKLSSLTTRDLSSDRSDENEKGLSKSFKAAADKPPEHRLPLANHMVAPVPLPLPPQAPPPPSASGPNPGDVLQAAQYLSDNWGNWDMHDGVSFSHPPADASSQEKSTLAYFANPVLADSIVADAGGKPGDPLSKAALDQFISDANGDAQAAAEALPPGTSSNSTLQDISDIVANWHAWGLHSGITPFSNPPPDDLPPDAKSALGAITSNPYLLSQIGNHTGSGAITRDDVADFLNRAAKNPVLLDQTPSTDTHVQDWLDSLGGAVSDQDKKALGQTGNDAQTLLDFFNAYPNNAPELNSEVPPDVADAEKRLLGVDAIKKQLVNSKGQVDRYTVGDFLKSLDGAADSAKASWASFQKSDPNADPTVTHMAADASILQADSPILDEAGPGSQLDGEMSAQDLQAVGNSGDGLPTAPGGLGIGLGIAQGLLGLSAMGRPAGSGGNTGDASLPSALKNAAALFSSPGMFGNLDIAGDDPATNKPDGLMDAKNLDGFISQNMSKMTPSSLLMTLNYAATSNLTAGVDISKLGPDVFNNPQNYSGAQKLAVMQQLQQLSAQITAGAADELTVNHVGLRGVEGSDLQASIQGKITQLQQDPDVQKLLSSNQQTTNLQSIVNADPGFKAALQGYYDGAVKNGSALSTALAAKDSSGNPVSVEQGLQDFMTQATTLSQALGANGKSLKGLDLRDIAQKSGQEGKLEQAYKDDILSGKELSDGIANTSAYGSAVQQFTSDAANFGAILPSKLVADNAAALQQTFSDTLSTSLLAKNDMSAFEDGNGNLDTGKLTSVVQQIEKQNPDEFKDSTGAAISPAQVVSAFKATFDSVRQFGGKLPDAIYKIDEQNWKDTPPDEQGPKPGKPQGPVAQAYSQGLMHIVSGLFGAGVLAAKDAAGDSKASIAVNNIAGSFSVIGAVMEGGSKYAKANLLGKPHVPSEAGLKKIESGGKLLGGSANIISGAYSLFGGVNAIKQGDIPTGVVDIATGVTNTWAGAAGLVEGGASAIDAFTSIDVAGGTLGALGATAAVLGGAAAIVTAAATIGLIIYEGIEETKQQNAFSGLVNPQLQQWGIPLPSYADTPFGPGYIPPPP